MNNKWKRSLPGVVKIRYERVFLMAGKVSPEGYEAIEEDIKIEVDDEDPLPLIPRPLVRKHTKFSQEVLAYRDGPTQQAEKPDAEALKILSNEKLPPLANPPYLGGSIIGTRPLDGEIDPPPLPRLASIDPITRDKNSTMKTQLTNDSRVTESAIANEEGIKPADLDKEKSSSSFGSSHAEGMGHELVEGLWQKISFMKWNILAWIANILLGVVLGRLNSQAGFRVYFFGDLFRQTGD